MRGHERHRPDHALRRGGLFDAVCGRSEELRPAAVHREEGTEEDGHLHSVRRRGLAVSRWTMRSWRSTRSWRRASACSSARASAGSPPSKSEHSAYLEGGPRKISPFFIPSAIINLAAGQVSIRFGAKGPNLATCTACTASAHAIGDSFEIIKRGAADAMIAGGAEAAVCHMGVGGFGALRALSHAQRRAGARQPAVRQGSRRLRARRRRRHPDPRRARVREAARRARSTPRSSATACPATRTT